MTNKIFPRTFNFGRIERYFLTTVVIALLVGISGLIINTEGLIENGTPFPSRDLRIIRDNGFLHPREAYLDLSEKNSQIEYTAKNQPEGTFWIALKLSNIQEITETRVVELRMLRASSVKFWEIRGNSRDEVTELLAANEKGGIAVRIPPSIHGDIEIIGRIEPIGVARPKIFVWNESAFTKSEMQFERLGGALIGSLIVLAIFSTFVGAINKDWSFFLFSGWLITSLRVASINEGWDLIWLGISLQNDLLLVILRTTLAAHALLTISLYRSLLSSEISESALETPLRYTTYGFMFLVAIAPILPHKTFLPILWTTSAFGIGLIFTSLANVVHQKRSSVSLWYACSWGVTFAGILTEVAYAAGLTATTVHGLNSQTASIASAVVTAIALAEKLRIERAGRLAAQRDHLETLAKFKENYNSMPIGLFSMNKEGIINLHNPAFSSIFSQQENSRHLSMIELLGKESFEALVDTVDNSQKKEIELSSIDPAKGSAHWYLARVTASEGSIEGSIQDITSRKEAETKLKFLVDHDSLTGLLNRRGLEQALRSAQASAKDGVPCAIAHVDMDRFKLVNDLYGHAVGDGMLQAAASRFNAAVRSTDHVARLADSFIIILLDCPDHAVTRLTERLREMISDQSFDIEGVTLNMTVSIGVVTLDSTMSTVDAMAAADRACAEAKAQGRNCVVRLNERDDTLRAHLEELKVVAGLRQRVPTERYFLEFQPIVSLRAANQSLNYEVLIRMRGDDGGVIPPGKFIGAAERNGLMSQIDRWVLLNTLEWLDQHPAHRDRLSFATLNLSGASLNDVRFIEDAFAMIAEHPIAATKLCFEITESIALNDVASTRRFVDRVRSFGSKLALDDFGAGYTSFNYLKEIPADFIKIDGSFVKDINRNPGNYAITRTIVELTHELGMSSIAEWAETADTIASLIHLQVDYGQGFGLARPLAKELVTNAVSSISMVRDPAVVNLLVERDRQVIAMHPAGPRRN